MPLISQKLKDGLYDKKYVILLISLVSVLWAPIIFQAFIYSDEISDITLIVLMVAIINFTRERKLYRRVTVVFFVFVSVSKSASLSLHIDNIDFVTWSAMLVYFTMFLFVLLQEVWHSKKVDVNTILGAIAGYIQIGVIAFILFKICDLLYNGTAFNRIVDISDIIYFSFVTLTTVGYGDISPTTDETKAFTVIFAMVGQFYMAILMALLVGKYQQEHQK
ncbi:potassium channel family protein [Flammeovirga sp. EKP202]|uniref:potassium channel family protein n=1 Tax=Flammeovirga sp. EKP202 TaxID=2770592 RepID=UPI00165FE486|nr:potassium channel family protein [Flammeovirga sp. EKP202]MBD0402697.1 two pore domain potassium channel family protein [Flammeovirga sp. EKP202]